MKQTITTLLLFLIFASSAFSQTEGSCGEKATWQYADGRIGGEWETLKTLFIRGEGALNDYTSTPVPWSEYINDIEQIYIDTPITALGDYLFASYPKLKKVYYWGATTLLNEGVFKNCDKLSIIYISDAVITVGKEAFKGCISLTSMPSIGSLVSIEESAFEGCTGMYSLFIEQNTLKSIEKRAFANCSSLMEEVKLGDNITSIGEGAFMGCAKIPSIKFSKSLETIGDDAFNGCVKLESIQLHYLLKQIGANAFAHCAGVKMIEVQAIIPPAVASSSFAGWGNDVQLFVSVDAKAAYQSADVWKDFSSMKEGGICGYPLSWDYQASTKTLTISGKGRMNNYTSLDEQPWGWLSQMIEKVVVNDGVTVIGERAFSDLRSLKSVDLPVSLTEIHNAAFNSCHQLGSITLPDGLEYIGNSAFVGCMELSEIRFPETLTTIDELAFWSCTKLESIVFPSSLKAITPMSFASCWGLTSITLPESNIEIKNDAFSDCPQLSQINCLSVSPYRFEDQTFDAETMSAIVYVPNGSLTAYKNHYCWSKFADIREFSTGIDDTHLGNNITINGNSITLDQSQQISVHKLSGEMVYNGYTREITLQDKGLYLVQFESGVVKVMIP